MTCIISRPDTEEKLKILSEDAQYDLACACSANKDEHRKRSSNRPGQWIYPVTLPNGGTSVLFKTLISNVCSNDCKYCPLRETNDPTRVSLTTEETVTTFLDYYQQKKVFGLFLSSGVFGCPDKTMQQLNDIARILRYNHKFKGYIHLKVIPGASDAAIEDSLSLANAVSVNIETPGEKNLSKLSQKKNYLQDIIRPLKLISKLSGKGMKYSRVKQTTQFIVGAAGEYDSEIVNYMWGLYDRLNLSRIYFSAYQQDLGEAFLSSNQHDSRTDSDILTREHRLYQVDFLFRKYGFTQKDISFTHSNQLDLTKDPKQIWADNHPESFPVNVNFASKNQLLKVPGLGPLTVKRILKRRQFSSLRSINDIGKPGKLLSKANKYLSF